jgi:pyruvate dehydrogenase E2 component (dihydrolipoamide acetyltransferase)
VTAQDVAGAPGQPGGGEAAASVAGARGGAAAAGEPEYTDTPVKGVRKRVAERMRQSLAESAQLTLHSSADARALLRLRKRVKEQGEALGIGNVTVNDMVMYAAVRALRRHPELNAHFLGDTIRRFNPVHLGFAVDTPRGLLVPVVHNADGLTLSGLAAESARLGSAGREGTIEPDALSGGTFTVTNLGAFGIEYFTPVLNTPQVAILGVNTIQDKPVRGEEGGVELVPHIGFSLTIDHQAVDGAPAARFLKELGQLIEGFDLALAM